MNDEVRHYYNYFQHGGELNVFHGTRDQHGYGLGNFFGRIARGVWDFIRPAASSAATSFISNAAQGLTEGKNFKDSARSALSASVGSAIRGLGDQAERKMQSGGRRRRKTKKIGMPKRKRPRVYKGRTTKPNGKNIKSFCNF